jgi:hypothetical protein
MYEKVYRGDFALRNERGANQITLTALTYNALLHTLRNVKGRWKCCYVNTF